MNAGARVCLHLFEHTQTKQVTHDTVTSWVNVVLLLCVQQQYKCSHVLGYALMLLVEVNGGLSREKGGGTT